MADGVLRDGVLGGADAGVEGEGVADFLHCLQEPAGKEGLKAERRVAPGLDLAASRHAGSCADVGPVAYAAEDETSEEASAATTSIHQTGGG